MRRINEILAVVILSLLAVLVAAVGFRAYDMFLAERQIEADLRRQEEIFLRNREANDRVLEMRQEIQELSQDREKLRMFLDEIQTGAEEVVPVLALHVQEVDSMPGGMTENAVWTEYENQPGSAGGLENGIVSENRSITENDAPSGNTGVSGNDMVSGNRSVSENGTVLGNGSVSENGTVSGNGSVSENGTVSENDSISGNDTVSGNGSVSENGTVSENAGDMWNLLPGVVTPEVTLEERRLLRSSWEETLLVNQEDLIRLAERQTDFSDMKIACLGDSITAAANLEDEEDYLSYAYPSVLKELLGAEEVYNLGIGGSSIGRYWADAFVDRYTQIPPDTDIIIVMGGTNDGFCLSEAEFGTLAQRAPGTFCGDLDELMRGLKEHYPNARIFFATPLPNILQDYLMRERVYLLPQKNLADMILTLSAEYGFETIDLYNSNILDSHDADIVADYMPDGVHCNKEGYRILAEHIAAEVVRSFENGAG